MTETLGEALPKEIERVLEIIIVYEKTQRGQLTAAIMKQDIKKAYKAMMEGDIAAMMAIYQELKEW